MLHRAKRHPNMRRIHNFMHLFSHLRKSCNVLILLEKLCLHDNFSSCNFLMSYTKPDASLMQALPDGENRRLSDKH